jgi:hypothetical protein
MTRRKELATWALAQRLRLSCRNLAIPSECDLRCCLPTGVKLNGYSREGAFPDKVRPYWVKIQSFRPNKPKWDLAARAQRSDDGRMQTGGFG